MSEIFSSKYISFILPSAGNIPIGGFKIIYEYANRLDERGYKINLIHVYRKNKTKHILKKIYRLLRFNILKLLKSYRPDNWFKIHNSINCIFIPFIDNKFIPNADIIFATEYTTAKPVNSLSFDKGKKFYFIQSLETWLGPDVDVIETWKLPMVKIVISRWLEEYAANLGQKSYYIPNAFDFSEFGKDVPIASRTAYSILMMFHLSEVKGSIYGLNAIIDLKKEFKELQVNIFSVYKKPKCIPDWINFHYQPNRKKLRELYNNASIFISPSLFEGFPLPPAEAMMCGSAVIASDIGGHNEYCIDNETALIVKPKSIEDIYIKTKYLILNSEKRIRIAESGHKFIKKYTWENAVEKMESVMNIR